MPRGDDESLVGHYLHITMEIIFFNHYRISLLHVKDFDFDIFHLSPPRKIMKLTRAVRDIEEM